ncbi:MULTISPECIES: enoyl-CoA hydratase/isomerase family protein [Nocardioides]|uniref:Enoyl-CoA hydratase/isomerase family protein n=1 Tax=Nocardioides vastitatis TaxID=2568655 RepID=A0ABW0ZMS4_9ACTN|nr:enoyl-CoA hydratase/isomerase family protein [Nocardioides sp.]THJ16022.1 enoyl-CoA hydratase/isomerase family protein [Nocardioides sp.]
MPKPADRYDLAERGGITCSQEGAVLTVTLNRPDVLNAMRPSTWTTLGAIGACIGDEVRAVVVRGAGESFSAGVDRRLLAGEQVGEDAPLTGLADLSFEDFDRTVAGYQGGFAWLRDSRFISIAAVQGYAIGAAFQLALACDIRIATDDVKFSLREPALGLVPDLTGTTNLVRAVGYSRALEWTASGRFVEADEAMASGLVSRVVAREDLDSALEQMVQGVTAHPHDAVAATKSLLLGAVERGFDAQRTHERAEQFRRFAALAAAK